MPSSVAGTDAERLIALLERQRDLYQGLRTLSEKQRATIAGQRPELLLEILRDRQDLVSALAQVNDELGPFRRHLDAVYAALPDEPRSQASGLLNEINGLLRAILRSDQEDSAMLAARKNLVGAQIAEMTGTRAAAVAYGRPGVAPSAAAADLRG